MGQNQGLLLEKMQLMRLLRVCCEIEIHRLYESQISVPRDLDRKKQRLRRDSTVTTLLIVYLK